MLGHVFFSSQSALRRLLQIRILDELRPEDEPVVVQGRPCWLDGLEVLPVLGFDRLAHMGGEARVLPGEREAGAGHLSWTWAAASITTAPPNHH